LPSQWRRSSNNESKRFFFEKKNQKTFAPVGCGNVVATAHRNQKFFCYFFSKKAVLPCLAIRLSGNSRNIIRRAARPRYRSATGGFDE
jgi:hypothetical protein